MSTEPDWTAVSEARTAYQHADKALPSLRAIHGELSTLAEEIVRGNHETTTPGALLAAVDALIDGKPSLAFLTEPVLEDDQTVRTAFETGRAVTGQADNVAGGLTGAAGGNFESLQTSIEAVVRPSEGPMAIDTTTLKQVVKLFEIAIESGIAAREASADRLQTALAGVYDDLDNPLPALDEQPIALLPVRLETRFVDDELSVDGDPSQLLVRVYPDQVHTDSHEEELTADEIRWGQTFWATLWYARHPDPSRVPDSPDEQYLRERLPTQHSREHVAEISAEEFSSTHHGRYKELKERAWGQLVDRFGRQRGAYIVHALEPTDTELANSLLTAPPEPETEDSTSGTDHAQSATGGTASIDPDTILGDTQIEHISDTLGQGGPQIDIDPDNLLPSEVPSLSFPAVDRKPEAWTQQPRAELLPDRWIAIAEWTTGTGTTKRTAVAGDPIREPLAVGPSPESVADADLAGEQTDSVAPDRTEWLVEYRQAEYVGMALRIRLSELSGFDPDRGFDRLTVLGVKGSLDAGESARKLRDVLDSHHYTDGLEFLEQGTSTNPNSATATATSEELPGLDTAVVPPLVEDGDRSDGDLLARALALDVETDSLVGDRHVFANVTNADGTEQRDARHANSALWPATMGYYLQQIGVDNSFLDNPSMWPNSATTDSGPDRNEHLLRLGAYRRHFIRFVRARGPFPALRIGDQPYGLLPARAIETERNLSVVDHGLVYDLSTGVQTIEDLQDPAEVESMVNSGVDPGMLVEAGADPDTVVEAGAAPEELVAGAVEPDSSIDPAELAPNSLLQDGVSLTATSRLDENRVEEAGIEQEDLDEAEITLRDLARGNVTDDQLETAGITTESLADVLLPPSVRDLGITPRTLAQAGVTPGALARNEITSSQLRKLGLSTRSVAEAVLPRAAREAGITPRKLADAGISATELVNGSVSAADLQRAGLTTEQLAGVLLPEELIDAGITPEQIGETVDLADLFNGDIDVHGLQEAGLTTEHIAETVLPPSIREAGITPDSLEAAGITPAAVLNGRITPADIYEAGVTPEALAEAGVLPDALAEVGSTAVSVVESGLDPADLIARGLSAQPLLDAGLTPDLLVDSGIAPKQLVDAGVHAAELVADAGISGGELLSAGVSPDQIARVGAAIETVSGGQVPAEQLVRVGFQAADLLKAGADATGVASGGARPSALQDAGVNAGTLREAGQAAGSLRRAGYDPSELVDSGYTAEELLNGGFSSEALREAGVPTEAIADAGRPAQELLGAGYSPAELKADGYGPEQLLEAGISTSDLRDAGYAAGELVDAGLSADALIAAGAEVQELRAAGISVEKLAEAGVEAAALATVGASAQQLLDAGFEPKELLDAGLDATELEVAGVDVDDLLADAADEEETVSTEDVTEAGIDTGQYAVTVLEEPEQAERDQYSFSFDPGLPSDRSRQPTAGSSEPDSTDPEDGTEPDGGTGAIPLPKFRSVDDQFGGELAGRVSALGPVFDALLDGNQAFTASKYTAGAHPMAEKRSEESMLVLALKRSALSTGIRQHSWVYSGEPPDADSQDSSVRGPIRKMGNRGGVTPDSDAAPLGQLLLKTGMTDLDPRLRYLKLLPAADVHDSIDHLTAEAQEWFGNRHRGKFRSTIAEDQITERSLNSFVNLLLTSTPKELSHLGSPLDGSEIEVTEQFAADADWESLSAEERLTVVLDELEGNSTLESEYMYDTLENSFIESVTSAATVHALASNQTEYGDTGYLHSLLRTLLYFGTVQEYVTARRRLGNAYDDQDGYIPQSSYRPQYPVHSLNSDIPEALASHPNIDTGGDDEYSYFQALQEAATPYESSTSIEPRMSEFADSLRYLSDLDTETLSVLTRETLDLCSHRLDAWWISLGTKRLLELREAQRTRADGQLDPEVWRGASDAPRATLDPALLSSVDLGATTPGPDPGTIANMDIQTGDSGGRAGKDGGPEADGGITGIGTDIEAETQPTEQVAVDELVNSGEAATLENKINPSDVVDAADAEPGLYVGGYGYVEHLSVNREDSDDIEYIHTPSRQQATTAALLRSGYEAHDRTDGANMLAVDLSAARVRAGMKLIKGVRQGQSLGELLGHRFERQLRQRTLWSAAKSDGESEDNGLSLMQYADEFRAAYPTTADSLERPDATDHESRADREEQLAIREVVDGRKLVQEWETYPFGREELPEENSDAYTAFEGIIGELRETLDAAGDLLTSESVHQFAQGNFQRVGGSLDALARGDQLPDPDVIRTPREHTGLSHRSCLLFGAVEADGRVPPRTDAEPALAAWAGELLPAHSNVECLATYRWSDGDTESTRETTTTLADLNLGALDVLSLFGADRQPSRSEIEQRLVYHLQRDRPKAVPVDAEIELELTETTTDGAVSMADLLELARSIRTFVGESRPITAKDLAHPTDDVTEGYDKQTVNTLTDRADEAQTALLDTVKGIDERLSVLDADHSRGDAVQSLQAGTQSLQSPAAAAGAEPTVTEQVAQLSAALDDVDETVPLSGAETAAQSADPTQLRAELDRLARALPAGVTDPQHATAELTVNPAEGQSIAGSIVDPADVPESDLAELVKPDTDQVLSETPDIPTDEADLSGLSSLSGSDEQFNQDVQRAPVPTESNLQTSLPEQIGFDGPTIEQPEKSTESVPETLMVRVWGTDGLSVFDRELTVKPSADGSFEVTIDCSEIEPGTAFSVVGLADGTVVYSARGRVISEDGSEADPQAVLNDSETLQQLLWLVANREPFTAGALADLDQAVEAADWAGIRAERDGTDTSGTVTQADRSLLDNLLGLDGTDPAGIAGAIDRAVRVVDQLGLERVLSVTGDGPPADADFWYAETAPVGDVRARTRRVLANPTIYNGDPASWLLSYDHRAAATLRTMAASDRVAAYLDAFLSGPGWLVRALDGTVEDPAGLLASLTTWLYSPSGLADETHLAAQLAVLAGAVEDLPALGTLFEGLPTAEGASTLGTFADILEALSEQIDAEVTVPKANTAQTKFDETITTAIETAGTKLATMAPTVDAVAGTPVANRFRNLVLEPLREPMTVAATYGIYGATPGHPDGGDPLAVRDLTKQAQALVERIRPRLADALALDPALAPSLSDRPVAARVDDQIDRLEALFGEEFTVLPPFEPANGAELSATFSDDALTDDHGIAAELLLQRAGTVRDRLDSFRETRSYAEAISGTPTPQLTVGQLPYEPGDSWVGVEGVEPQAGTLSLLAQFGPGVSANSADSRLTGLFVDQWNESVPSESETTGVALNYDDPGSRPPQSILIAPPPEDGSWSLDALAATVDETAAYVKRRAVDVGDLASTAAFKPFPMLFYPSHVENDAPPAGNVSFEQIQQYSRIGTKEMLTLFYGGNR